MQSPIQADRNSGDPILFLPGSEKIGAKPSYGDLIISFRQACIIGASLIVFLVVAMILLRNDPEATTTLTDIAAVIIDALVTLAIFYGAKQSFRFGKRIYYAWIILAFSRLAYVIGDWLWAYTELILHENPFPSISDLFYIIQYVLFFIAIFMMPSFRFSFKERIKLMLDTGIIFVTSVLVFWVLIISPTIEQSLGSDPLTFVLSVAYPVIDMFMFFAVLELIFKRIYSFRNNPLLFLACGIGVFIITDIVFFRQTLAGTYEAGLWTDMGWNLSYILIGLAGISQAEFAYSGNDISIHGVKPHYGQWTWPLFLPYLSAAIAFALLIWSHYNSIGLSFATLSWAVGCIIGMVIIRQVLALNENAEMYQESQVEIADRIRAEMEVNRLNEELERRVEERTRQLEATNRDLQSQIVVRQMAEEALRDSERRLKDIIDFLPDATFVINKNGIVIAWNRAIEKLTGINAKQILGKDNYEYALPFYGERRPILIDLVLNSDPSLKNINNTFRNQSDGTLNGEFFVSDLNGKETYLLEGAAILCNSEGEVYGAIEVMRDITERKLAEDELMKAKDRAESAVKAKSEFLANMSHEIRTPMNAVIGMTGLLMNEDLKPEQRDYLETIRNSGNALLSIIDDILDYSKIDSGKMQIGNQPFDLQNCIDISVDLVATKAAEKGLELTYYLEEGVPRRLLGDEIRLRQILINLLGNAVKFTEKGDVSLSVSSSATDNEKHELHFSVKDSGIGISKESQSKLFQSFTQVDSSTTRSYGGTGLGLAISKRFVEMMGGKIWIESELGLGSTFHFTIVLKAIKQKEPIGPQDLILTGKRAIIVTGNDALRNILNKLLSSWGLKVSPFASGVEVMDILGRETYDFAIIDEMLPDICGIDLARDIKSINTFILIMIPIGSRIKREEFVASWLSKPIKPFQLRKLLIELLLPQNENKAMAAKSLPLPASPAQENNLTILLAEDNPVNQKVALSMLKYMGYNADVAANGLEVLQALDRKPYDIILMDIQMPEMDGLETTRRIREREKSAVQPYIIAMTAYALEGDREEFLKAGMNEYLSKPIRKEELQTTLERYSRTKDTAHHEANS